MFTPQFVMTAFIVMILIVTLPAFVDPAKYRKALKGLYSDTNYIRLMGVFSLLLGFIFLSVHWKLKGEWLIMISLIGWISVIKGICRVWWPEYAKKKAKKTLLTSDRYIAAMSFIAIIAVVVLALITYHKLGAITMV